MKELEYLDIINKTLSDSSLLGDDCAYLKEFDICITQDTLVEGVHFMLNTTDALTLAQKAVNVNLSDLAASGAEPLYITISLSLPKNIDKNFVEEFYKGVQIAISKYKVKVAGGDLTGADKVFVSICAIGKKYNTVKVSRNCAKPDDIIVVTGTHGSSAGGLKLLFEEKKQPEELINKHLLPAAQIEKSEIIMQTAFENGIKNIAMMDSSDGLADAIYKLSTGCGYLFDIDCASIPVDTALKNTFPDEWKNFVMWGGEDFQLVCCLDKKIYEKLDKTKFFKIGKVCDKKITKEIAAKLKQEFENKSFKHF